MVYFFILIFSIIWWYIVFYISPFTLKSKDKNLLFIIPVTFIFWLVMGFRGINVGIDTKSYYRIFNYISDYPFFNIPYLSETLDVEYGFVVYCKLLSLICKDYLLYQAVTSLIICLGLSNFIIKKSDNVFISFLIIYSVFYLWGFNITRQVFAAVLIINGWVYFSKKKYMICFCLYLAAISLHVTSILGLIIIFIWSIKNYKFINYIPILIVIFLISFKFIISFFSNFDIYVNYFNHSKSVQTAGGVIIIWMLITLTSLYLIYKYNDINAKLYSIFSLFFVMSNICGLDFNYFERLGLYFYPFVSLSLPLFSKILNKLYLRQLYISGLSILYCYYFLISVGGQYVYCLY